MSYLKNRDVRDAITEAKLLKKLIAALNRIDQLDVVRLHSDEQQVLAKARARYATIAAYVFQMGETLS